VKKTAAQLDREVAQLLARPRHSRKAQNLDLDFVVSDEDGVHFETGVPVTFRSLRNTEKSPYVGATFGQDIEPAGRYLLHVENPGTVARGWETGVVTLRSPLVIPLSGDPDAIYGPKGWKARLHEATGKKGRALSTNLLRRGYDGIVTVDDSGYTREIVLLKP
jgi:hypothetical protein